MLLNLPRFLRPAIAIPNFMVKELKPREVKWVAHLHLTRSAIGRTGSSICQQNQPYPSWCAGADTCEAHSFFWTVVILSHAFFKYDFFIFMLSPLSIPCSSSWIIAVWVGTLKLMAHSSKSLSLIWMPFPSHPRSHPSPSGQAVKIFSGYEPPSWTSSLFFKPKHQCGVHMHKSHKFFYSFHFQHSFYFQGVKGLFRVHKSLCTQWHFILSSLPWDFFIFCRWSWVEKWLLNPAYSGGRLKSRSPCSLPTSTFVKILHNYWKQFKRSCLWSIKRDFF